MNCMFQYKKGIWTQAIFHKNPKGKTFQQAVIPCNKVYKMLCFHKKTVLNTEQKEAY